MVAVNVHFSCWPALLRRTVKLYFGSALSYVNLLLIDRSSLSVPLTEAVTVTRLPMGAFFQIFNFEFFSSLVSQPRRVYLVVGLIFAALRLFLSSFIVKFSAS